MKTTEELNALREEVEALDAKLAELTEEELSEVTGGESNTIMGRDLVCPECGYLFERVRRIMPRTKNFYCQNCKMWTYPRVIRVEISDR